MALIRPDRVAARCWSRIESALLGVLCPGRAGWGGGSSHHRWSRRCSTMFQFTVRRSRQHAACEGGGWREVFVLLPRLRRGIYSVAWCIVRRASAPSRSLRSFSYMVPAGTPGRASSGSAPSQWHPPEVQELQALAASLCGVKMLREDMLWERMEPRQGAWNFRFFDSEVKKFDRHGIEVAPIYCYRPEWAVARDWKPIRPESPRGKRPDFGHWANFIRTAASRYGDRIRYVEVWNEPDLLGYANFTAEEYIEMLKIAYAETKKAAPDVTVLTGGLP